jgi:hypothetical protein
MTTATELTQKDIDALRSIVSQSRRWTDDKAWEAIEIIVGLLPGLLDEIEELRR